MSYSAAPAVAAPPPAPVERDPVESSPLFQKFFANVKSKGFFDGVAEGSEGATVLTRCMYWHARVCLCALYEIDRAGVTPASSPCSVTLPAAAVLFAHAVVRCDTANTVCFLDARVRTRALKDLACCVRGTLASSQAWARRSRRLPSTLAAAPVSCSTRCCCHCPSLFCGCLQSTTLVLRKC
jgi:hypothetical protein